MSTVIVNLLDKIVWLLIVTVLTTQSLQIAGFVETPKSAGALEYRQDFAAIQENAYRFKRDTETDTMERSQFIDTIFNRKSQRGWMTRIENAVIAYKAFNKIPIKTLTAVNNLIQNSRPALKKLRDFAAKRFEKTTKAPDVDGNTVQKRSYPVFIRPFFMATLFRTTKKQHEGK